jgi:hypothetical protein
LLKNIRLEGAKNNKNQFLYRLITCSKCKQNKMSIRGRLSGQKDITQGQAFGTGMPP